jgi:hypothetical protein
VSTAWLQGLGRTGTAMLTVALIFPGFRPPRVRSNARKNSNFKFLKTATVVFQHIGQGFQNYFCSEEISCFAKI